MNTIISRHDLTIEPERGMSVTQCGLTICSPGHSVPLQTYSHFSAHFIIDGCGLFAVGNKVYSLKAGDGFMIFPDIPNYYIADEHEPFTYIYVNFSGFGDLTLCRCADITPQQPTFSFDLSSNTTADLFNLYNISENNKILGYDVLAQFLFIMSTLIKENIKKSTDFTDYAGKYYLENVVSYIENNYSQPITVNDMANFIKIDRTYLYRLFMNSFKMSPSKFLVKYRLSQSVMLLKTTDSSLTKIALACGFYDSSHFTKCFVAEYGCTPSEYKSRL